MTKDGNAVTSGSNLNEDDEVEISITSAEGCSSMGAWPVMFDCPKQRKIQKFWSCACNCNDALSLIISVLLELFINNHKYRHKYSDYSRILCKFAKIFK